MLKVLLFDHKLLAEGPKNKMKNSRLAFSKKGSFDKLEFLDEIPTCGLMCSTIHTHCTFVAFESSSVALRLQIMRATTFS